MTDKKAYRLDDLLAQCDSSAPVPEGLQEWDQAPAVGLEQLVMGNQVDIREAVLLFQAKLADRFNVVQLTLFGSRARGDYHDESDADVAVLLSGQSGDFVKTKLSMADLAFDTLLETGVRIQALPIWECEWANPEAYSNPELLRNVANDGIVLWRA